MRYHLSHSPKLERIIIKTRQVTLATIDNKLTLCSWLINIIHYDFHNYLIRVLVIRNNQTTTVSNYYSQFNNKKNFHNQLQSSPLLIITTTITRLSSKQLLRLFNQSSHHPKYSIKHTVTTRISSSLLKGLIRLHS